MRRPYLLALAMLMACGDDPIEVRTHRSEDDYNRTELMTAVDAFVASGRTVAAYGKLAADVARLRPGMDATVAELAELQLVTLAAGPVESMRSQSRAEQARQLALTVWAVALAPAIHVFAPDGWRDPREGLVAPRPGETAEAYVERMCGGPLAFECNHVVPEWQGLVISAEATSHLTSRARSAVANCEECADPAWHDAVSRWEALDRAALVARHRAETMGAKSRWPVAGAAAEPWPESAAAVVALDADGEWQLDETTIEPGRRIAVLRELHAGGATTLGVHTLPGVRLDALDLVIATAASAGFAEVAVQARVGTYPWQPRAYRLPAVRAPKRKNAADTVQSFLRGRDARAPSPPPAARRP